MPEAQVKMNVRKASEKVSIIDVEGELTAFAEDVLWTPTTRPRWAGTRDHPELRRP